MALTYTLDDTAAGKYALVAGQIQSAGVLTAGTDNVTVTATDDTGWSKTKIIPITVTAAVGAFLPPLSDALWSKVDTTLVSGALDGPRGTLSADRLTEVASSNVHRLNINRTIVSGTTYRIRAKVKDNGQRYVVLALNTSTNNNQYFVAIFDLTAVSVTFSGIGSGGGTYTSSSITADAFGNGWYVIEVRGSLPATDTLLLLAHNNNGTTLSPGGRGSQSYAGSTSRSFYVDGIELEAV